MKWNNKSVIKIYASHDYQNIIINERLTWNINYDDWLGLMNIVIVKAQNVDAVLGLINFKI